MSAADGLKRAAAESAVDRYVEAGMRLGLGSGSTAAFVVRALADRLADGRLADLVGVASSDATAALAQRVGVPLATFDQEPELDLAIDGADEIDPELRLIKGGGGAHLREKVVVRAARRFVVVADESKLVRQLGERFPLPVEVIPFALPLVQRLLAEAGWRPLLRMRDGAPVRTDQGDVIVDCTRADWSDPASLARAIEEIPGAIAHGLFLTEATAAVVATAAGGRVLGRPVGAAAG
jgi:ribose 5-phosphate isomerase A